MPEISVSLRDIGTLKGTHSFELVTGINLVVGKNGCGKTSLIDTILAMMEHRTYGTLKIYPTATAFEKPDSELRIKEFARLKNSSTLLDKVYHRYLNDYSYDFCVGGTIVSKEKIILNAITEGIRDWRLFRLSMPKATSAVENTKQVAELATLTFDQVFPNFTKKLLAEAKKERLDIDQNIQASLIAIYDQGILGSPRELTLSDYIRWRSKNSVISNFYHDSSSPPEEYEELAILSKLAMHPRILVRRTLAIRSMPTSLDSVDYRMQNLHTTAWPIVINLMSQLFPDVQNLGILFYDKDDVAPIFFENETINMINERLLMCPKFSFVVRLVSGDYPFMSQMSDGFQHTFPILVLLANLKSRDRNFNNVHYDRGDLYEFSHILQPELHLHPSLQFELGRLLCQTVSDLKLATPPDPRQISFQSLIIETHSEHFIRGIRKAMKDIARENAPRVECNCIIFSKDVEGDFFIRQSELNSNGEFNIPWPTDFFPDPRENLE